MTERSVTESELNAASQENKKSTMDFGEALRASREQQNYSVEDVSKAIHLTAEIINAIDISDVNRLPEPAFVQGYLRVYARFLGVHEEAVLEDYSNCVPHSLESELKRRSVLPREAHSGSPFIKTITIVLLVLTCLAIAYGIYSYYSEIIDTKEASDEHDTGELFLPSYDTNGGQIYGQTVEKSFDSDKSVTNGQLDVSETSNDMNMTGKEPSLVESTEEVVVEQVVEVKDVIWMKAKAASWVEVVDSDKVMLHYDLLKKGRSLSLTGIAPFDVYLGNAPDIEVKLNDINIEMQHFIRSNNTAQFTVSVSDQEIIFH